MYTLHNMCPNLCITSTICTLHCLYHSLMNSYTKYTQHCALWPTFGLGITMYIHIPYTVGTLRYICPVLCIPHSLYTMAYAHEYVSTLPYVYTILHCVFPSSILYTINFLHQVSPTLFIPNTVDTVHCAYSTQYILCTIYTLHYIFIHYVSLNYVNTLQPVMD